ncbi:ABC transporter substrate-binding protein [Arthrobacter halodurans]|uniref:ABC transporter substrate-binding protein n=1 Tax=Arthrobacter halodurans TaxID=516699 RepID=A0ABV4UL47_9MICC
MRASFPSTLALGLAALVALTGCGFNAPEGGAPTTAGANQRIVVDNFRAPVADWALESDAAYILSLSGCLETLTRYDESEGKVVSSLATEWKQVSDLEWEFTLRDGVRFQDGTPLTADAVVTSLRHVLDADVPARAFNPTVVSDVEATDARTVRITTPSASPLVPYRLASVNTGILSPSAFAGKTVDPFGTCTGPFVAVSEKPKQSVTLDRNADYWGGEVQLAGAEVRFITDGATRATQVQTGEADISLSVPVSSLSALEAATDVEVLKADSPRTATLYMNNGRAPFDDVDVRKAVGAAIDLNALASSVYEGAALPANGPFAPSEPWAADDAPTPVQDVAVARELLSKAGYTADRPLEIIAIVERAEFADVATVIQENLKAVGVPVEIRTAEYAAVEPDLLAGDYDMVLSQRNRLIDIADPIGFLSADYTCDGGYNLSHFCDEDYDKLVAQASETADAQERYRLYGEAGKILQEQAVNVWLVNEQAIDAARTAVGNHTQDPLSRYVVRAETSKSGS